MTVSILLPSIGRAERLKALLKEIKPEVEEVGAEVVLVFDIGEAGIYDDLNDYSPCYTKTQGYWKCLNVALGFAKYDTILWTADDIIPQSGWLKTGLSCFQKNFPKGLGIVGMNDLYVRELTCGHAITSKRFMKVLFEDGRFPEDFAHLYLDTMVADWAKWLQRYVFCEAAVVEHDHYLTTGIEQDKTSLRNEARARENKDKLVKDRHDQEWYNGGMASAIERLRMFEEE